MKHSKKKKKRSQPPNRSGAKGAACGKENEESKVLNSLAEAFTSVSLDEAASAYREAKGDPNKAAEILGGLPESADDQATVCSSSSGCLRFGSLSLISSLGNREAKGDPNKAAEILGGLPESVDDQTTVCPSSSGSLRLSSSLGSSSQEGFMEDNFGRYGFHVRGFREPKQKKVVAATGTVSTVLGKDYVMSSSKKDSSKSKGYTNGLASKEEAEQFLCSMLGDDCELSMAVVRDVLCQCGYGVEKALNALLELSASSYVESKSGQSCELSAHNKEDEQVFFECSDNVTDRSTDSTSQMSESEIQDSIWSMGYHCRNYAEDVTGSEVYSQTDLRSSKSELPQKVLESLFNMPNNSEHEPSTMNWRDIVKKMESLGNRFECVPGDAAQTGHIHAKGDEYQVFREAATQHWDSMKSCYQKAATAFSNGERAYAACLSDQGRVYSRMAREADEKASQDIFKARNKSIENVITIDLHGQHIKQALRLLKVHLLFGAYVRSVQIFRVITGCGSHHVGKSKLKQSIPWKVHPLLRRSTKKQKRALYCSQLTRRSANAFTLVSTAITTTTTTTGQCEFLVG